MAHPEDPRGERSGRPGCGYGALVALGVLGAVVLPVYGLLSVMKSDVCEPESAAYFCSGAGQNVSFWTGLLAGPGAFVVAGLAAAVSRRVRGWWAAAVVGVQAAGFVVISVVSSMVE